MGNRLGRQLARKLLNGAGLTSDRDEETGDIVIAETAIAGTAEITVELGRGETLLDAIEDAMLGEEDADDDPMEDYGLVFHLAAALAEDARLTLDCIASLTQPLDETDPADDDDDDDDDDPDDGEEVPVAERRSVIDLFPRRAAGES